MTDSHEEHVVVFTPSGLRGHFDEGTTLLQAARQIGVDLDSVCGGRGICGRCQVEPTFGEFSKYQINSIIENLDFSETIEESYSGRRPLDSGRHLGCAAKIRGDLVIAVPSESQVHQQVVRKEINLGEVELDPVLVLRYVELPQGEFDDIEKIFRALTEQWGINSTNIKSKVTLEDFPSGHNTVTVAIRDESEIVAVWPGLVERVLGAAIDVGSTTIAGHLCDLGNGQILASGGRMNPQIRFGEDLMSRVSYVMMNPDGRVELTSSVRTAIDDLLGELCEKSGVHRDEVLELTLVCNPVIHHLLLGLDPTPLGVLPFTLEIDEAVDLIAEDLGLSVHSQARAHILPCIAGHVGADTSAAILATNFSRSTGIHLLVDVGTNAEIVLTDSHRVLAASSPTGPAFEGAQVSSGQRATAGAIERVRINPETGEPRFRVIGVEKWSDEEGFDKAISQTGVTGICGSGIIDVVAELRLSNLMSSDGVIGGPGTRDSSRIEADGRTFSYVLYKPKRGGTCISITQNDVRAIQLAKAALYAGIRLLMDRLKINYVESISLAGAFGSHIDALHASVLGLIPDCDLDQIVSVGNAAGAGAVIALLSGSARREIQEVVMSIEKVETATEESFQSHFVEAMAIPHQTAEFHNLKKHVILPGEVKAVGANVSRSDRRRSSRRKKSYEQPK